MSDPRIVIEIGGSQAGELVRGERISGWSGLSVVRTIDSGADAFSFNIPWNPTAANLERFRPYSAQQVVVWADDEKLITGYLEMPSFSTSEGSRTANLQGRSITGVLIDWSAGPPFQLQGLTFNQIASKIAHPYSVRAVPDTQPIADVQITPGQTIYEFLSSLAAANGLYGRPTATGTLEYVTITGRSPVADLTEGEKNIIEISASHDLTKLHNKYLVIASSDGNPDISASVTDSRMAPAIRGTKIIQPQQESADYSAAARFARSRAYIDSYTPQAVVKGWRHNTGFWRAGEVVRVYAPGAFIVRRSLLIIKRVTFSLDESSGRITTLDLALPEAYSNTYPEATPWES
jgi:prophage tail gpP-like protein